MKKILSYLLLILVVAFTATGCKDDGVEISDAHKSKTPKNVRLLEYSASSLTVCWDFIYGATSYTVQLVGSDMNPVSEALCKTTANIDYHEFTNLPTNQFYYARVRANYPYSSTSDWVYVTKGDQPAMLMASIGVLEISPALKLIAATGSTLTFEWSYTGDEATDASRAYNIELFRDEACKDLYLSWVADGKLTSGKGLFTGLAGYPVVRFTFSGLEPQTTYYARVKNSSFADIPTPVVAGKTAQAGPAAATDKPAKTGDIVLAEDFAKFIHGGDVARSAAAYNAPATLRGEYAKAGGENPVADGLAPCDWSAEFNVFDGGSVTADYTKAVGMEGWGKNGNTSTRPGYVKIGGNAAVGALYTPQLGTLPDGMNTTVEIAFTAAVYTEGKSAYSGNVLVQVVEGAEFSAKGAMTKPGKVIVSKAVDISAAVGTFAPFSVTLEGLTPTSRIVFSSDPDQKGDNKTRFLLDDIVVTSRGDSRFEKLATPAGTSFDASATTASKLGLKWTATANAASYTVAYWKGSAAAPEKDYLYVTDIDGKATSTLLENLASETQYWAKVKAVAGFGFLDSDWSQTATATTQKLVVQKLPTPQNLTATAEFSTIALTWNPVEGATGYRVAANGKTQDVTTASCIVGELALGVSYPITVVALAAQATDNSDAAGVTAKTLSAKIAATTTSNIVFEWDKAATATKYTVSITEKGTSASQSFTYDWAVTKGWNNAGDVPLRFTFHQNTTAWPAGKLSAAKRYQMRVKTETGEWSAPIEGTVRAHTSVAGEIFWENFDDMPGSDAVMLSTGAKSSAKVETLANLFQTLTPLGWMDGAGALSMAGGSFSADVQLGMFKDTGWTIGVVTGSSIVNNAFNGCVRLGGDNANQSYITTPAMSALTAPTTVTVNFKTAANVFWQTGTPGAPAVSFDGNWRRDQFDAMELYIVHADGSKSKVGSTIAVGEAGKEFEWKSHSIQVEGVLPTDKLMFTSVASAKSRYYIDEISVVKK